MDNNAFEKEMIKAVNDSATARANAAVASAKFAEDAKKWQKRRKAQRIRAIIELICWLLGVVAIGIASHLGMIGGGWVLALLFVAGIRVGGLIRVI